MRSLAASTWAGAAGDMSRTSAVIGIVDHTASAPRLGRGRRTTAPAHRGDALRCPFDRAHRGTELESRTGALGCIAQRAADGSEAPARIVEASGARTAQARYLAQHLADEASEGI